MARTINFLALFIVLGLLTGAAAQDKPAPKLEKTKLGALPKSSAFADIIFGGQPSADDLKEAKKKGVKAVLNLREAKELDFDEAALVKQLEMKYHHVPFQGVPALTDDVFDQVRAVLNDKGERPLLLHCAAANRVGAVWLAYRVLDTKAKFDDALKEAEEIGLTTPGYIEKAKIYIEKKQK